MNLFITANTAKYDKLFGEMVTTVEKSGYRATGFVFQQINDKARFYPYPISMPSHLMHGYATKHHLIILRYNYHCVREAKGVYCHLENVKIFYPQGMNIPYRVFKDYDGKWKLFEYDRFREEECRSYSKGVSLFNESGVPHFPRELMVDTIPKDKFYKPKPDKERKTAWKGLASMYIMA